MIRRKSINCNINSIKIPSNFLFTYSKRPDLSVIHCPSCGAPGHFKSHGSYDRYVIDLIHGKPVTYRVSILRIECECGHTHALLKDTLIPYCQYTPRFIIYVLKAYFHRNLTVEHICERFQISPSTLYRFKKIFLSHQQIFLGLLASQRVKGDEFIRFIEHISVLSDFFNSFFRLSGYSFLQTHANPAGSCRRRCT